MGAVNQLDLTSDVTHLVVGELNTPKYRYVAKERPDVKVLDRDWVEAVRQSWIEGGETDVRMLEEKHKFPVFSGLKICFTGVENVDERQKLQELVTANGAEYHADLTKLVTHLMAKKPEGRKHHYASTWGLHIVTLEWLRDSLERGMTLDEREYTHSIPREERGKNAWIRRTVSGSCLGKRSRDDAEAAGGEFGERRKLRRSASQKLGSQNVSIWDDIIGGGFGEKAQQRGEWDETPLSVAPIRDNAILDSNHKRQDSLAPGLNNSGGNMDVEKDKVVGSRAKSKGRGGLFQGRKFVLHGFDQKKTSVLREHLSSHDAEISSSISELSQPNSTQSCSESYVVVPHSSMLSKCPDIPDGRATIVNEWWIERCLYYRDFVDPDENVTSRPFPHFPIAGFERMTICSTAFGDVDLLHISKLVDLMGATYDGSLTKRTSVLICNSTSAGMKIKHAFMWDIPAVSAEWLWDCVKTGQVQPFERYYIPAPKRVANPSVPHRSEAPDGRMEPRRNSGGQANAPSRRTGIASQAKGQARCAGEPASSESREKTGIAERPTGMSTMSSEENSGVHCDGSDNASHSGMPKRGTPLQDLGQEVNSTSQGTLSTPEAPLAATGSDPQKGEDIGEKIAELLRRQQGQLLRDQPPTGGRGRRPRCGLLGRTASTVSSHASITLTLSGASTNGAEGVGGTPSLKILGGSGNNNNNAATDDDLELLSQERSHAIAEVPLASQVVTYEDPEAQKQKERVMRKLSGLEIPTPKAKKTRSIGVARDSAAVKRSTRQRPHR
ncbi:MAG: hypothetical protein M1840_006592 [Geoglossum simile]|nr:MAG: hypothetical protein M1840_006592 [Geoglossum simile]